ncbi:hypothetical protein ABZP36_034831 [Zizania latifolia]
MSSTRGTTADYERVLFRMLSALIEEDKDDDVAIEWHFELLKEFPRDLMSLKRAQLICFYLGCLDTSLKFVEHFDSRVLGHHIPQWYFHTLLGVFPCGIAECKSFWMYTKTAPLINTP